MAGGHGGLTFLANGTIWKETNETELAFYLSIYEGHHASWALKEHYRTLQTFVPLFYGFRPARKNQAPAIHIGNLTIGINHPEIMDIKIGSWTASKHELIHTGLSSLQAWRKRRKIHVADWWTKSTQRGYRIVDIGEEAINRANLARRKTDDVLAAFFDGNVQRLQYAAQGLLQLEYAIAPLPNIFISSSVLFCYDPYDARNMVRLALIDFGHTHAQGTVRNLDEEKYKISFRNGLRALYNDLCRTQLHLL